MWEASARTNHLERGGIRFGPPAAIRGMVIRRSVFHHFSDGLEVCPSASDGGTRETDVYENLVYKAGDDGTEMDGQCSNVRRCVNTVHNRAVSPMHSSTQGGDHADLTPIP
jgi:hypothetical protein